MEPAHAYQQLNICLVEDDAGDAKAIKRAFSKAGATSFFTRARNGEEALDILRSPGQELPDHNLVLLDLNMPRMNGIEFLKELRSDDSLRRAVVFVLTTSADRRDIESAFEHNVAGYFLKTGEDGYKKLIETLTHYWQTSLLPEFPDKRREARVG